MPLVHAASRLVCIMPLDSFRSSNSASESSYDLMHKRCIFQRLTHGLPQLNSIDNMRHDGKFIVNGDIPEGQGSVIDLLSECFDLAYELRNEAEKEPESENDSDDDRRNGDPQPHSHGIDEQGGGRGGAEDADYEENDGEGVTMKKVTSVASGAGSLAKKDAPVHPGNTRDSALPGVTVGGNR